MKRYGYLFKKVGWSVYTILFIIVLNFFLFRVLPGDPVKAGTRDPRFKKENQEAMRVRFGLDKPLINCCETLSWIRVGGWCMISGVS